MSTTAIATTRYLGPGRVQLVKGEHVTIQLPEGPVKARLALAVPYDPKPGDVVLVIGEEDYFVIGVLKGSGRLRLDAPGDLILSARGRVQITGAEALELTSPRISIRADRFETVAQVAFQRFMNSYTWVKGVMQTTAQRWRTLVEQTASLSADRIVERARQDVSIDGEKIRLG